MAVGIGIAAIRGSAMLRSPIIPFCESGFAKKLLALCVGLDYAMREPRTGEPAPVMSAVEGSSQIPEIILGHWEGYRGSGPVPIGNGAATQFQIAIYGELMDSFYLTTSMSARSRTTLG